MDRDFVRNIKKQDLTKVNKSVVVVKIAEETKKEEKKEDK